MKSKKCTTEQVEPTSCDEYSIQHNWNQMTKEGCESVKLTNDYEICFYNENTQSCYVKTLPCSSYTGNDPKVCRLYAGADKTKACDIVGGKCVEIDNYIYKRCGDYTGKDLKKEVCEGIQPKNVRNEYDFTKKCVFKGYYCDEVTKECSDAKSEIECSIIKPTDQNKICIFKGNSCVEQYKSCEAYQNSESTKGKNICESIILENDFTKKCKFNEGSNTCTEVNRACSDFIVDSIANECYNYTDALSLDTERCSYSNNTCSLINNPICLELYHSKDATEEICSKAKVSSENKICSLKSDNSGCDEFSKTESTSTSEGEAGDDGKYLDIFSIALLALQCFLF